MIEEGFRVLGGWDNVVSLFIFFVTPHVLTSTSQLYHTYLMHQSHHHRLPLNIRLLVSSGRRYALTVTLAYLWRQAMRLVHFLWVQVDPCAQERHLDSLGLT